jgi:hypothetical protein
LSFGGEVAINANYIVVRNMYGSAPLAEFSASVYSEVQIVNNVVGRCDGDGESLDVISQLEDQHVQECNTDTLEASETLLYVEHYLPNGNCKAVFQLLSGVGPIYQDFVRKYPDTPRINQGIPHKNRMAKFLNCTAKEIKQHQQIIGMQLIAQGIATDD